MNHFTKKATTIAISLSMVIVLFGCINRQEDPFYNLAPQFNVGPPVGAMIYDLKNEKMFTTGFAQYDKAFIVYNCNLPLYYIYKQENDNRLDLSQVQLLPNDKTRAELIERLGGLDAVNNKLKDCDCKNTHFGYDYLYDIGNSTEPYSDNDIPSDMRFDVTTAEDIMKLLQEFSLSEIDQMALNPEDYNISVPDGAELYAQFGKETGKDNYLMMCGRVKGKKSDFLIVVLTMGAGNPSYDFTEILKTVYESMEK